MRHLEIRLIKNQHELEQVFEIRKQAFVQEQDVPLELELDGLDDDADHVIVYYNEKPIGCARIRINEYAKLERVAILKQYRNRGFGTQLMHYLIDYCKSKNITEIRLHSQTYVSDFYEKIGFITRGKPFFEAGIEHAEMYMKIRP